MELIKWWEKCSNLAETWPMIQPLIQTGVYATTVDFIDLDLFDIAEEAGATLNDFVVSVCMQLH